MTPSFATIIEALRPYRFIAHDERRLYLGLSEALTAAGIVFERERTIQLATGRAGRLDYYVPAYRLAIEVKVGGSPAAILRQLRSYAEHPDVDALLLITSLAKLAQIPDTLAGKPARSYRLTGGFG